MRPVIGAAALGALAMGGVILFATSRQASNAQANQTTPAPVVVATPAPAPTPVASPAPTVARHDVTYTNTTPRTTTTKPRVVTHTRSTKNSVAIIGGSTVGGALVGGLVGGKKGALIGGVVAGTAGTVYDRKTRKKTTVE